MCLGWPPMVSERWQTAVVTLVVGIAIGSVSTIVVTKAATNRHLAELEDELIEQLDQIEAERAEYEELRRSSSSGSGGGGNDAEGRDRDTPGKKKKS